MTPRDSRLAEAFQDCLARTTAGESPEQVLASQPADLRAELRAALVAALTLRQRRPAPAPAFAERLQGQLDEAMAGLYPPLPARTPWWAVLSTPRLALRLAAVLVAVVLAGTSLTLASANSRPGDLLYPVHTLVQRLGTAGSAFFARAGGASSDAAAGSATARRRVPTARPTPAATEVLRQGPEPAAGASNESAPAMTDRAAGTAGSRSTVVRPMAVALTATATRTAAGSATPAASPSRTPVLVHPTLAPTLAPAAATALPTAVPPEPTDEPPDATAVPTATRVLGPGSIAGRITDGDGQPVAGVRVRALRSDRRRGPGGPGGPGDPGGPGGRGDALTDADGRYRIDGLRPDDYLVSAEDRGNRPPHWYPDGRNEKDAEPVTVRSGAVTDGIDIRFERQGGGKGPGTGPGTQSTAAPTASPSPTATPAEPTATPADPTATPSS